jgi:hypothetical protein
MRVICIGLPQFGQAGLNWPGTGRVNSRVTSIVHLPAKTFIKRTIEIQTPV